MSEHKTPETMATCYCGRYAIGTRLGHEKETCPPDATLSSNERLADVLRRWDTLAADHWREVESDFGVVLTKRAEILTELVTVAREILGSTADETSPARIIKSYPTAETTAAQEKCCGRVQMLGADYHCERPAGHRGKCQFGPAQETT